MKSFQMLILIFSLTSAFSANSEVVTTSPGSYMLAEYNLAEVEQDASALWQFYSGSGSTFELMTHSISYTSSVRYELKDSPYTYMSYIENINYVRGHPMNNGSVGVFLLAPTFGIYEINSSLWKQDSGTVKYSIYNDEVVATSLVSGTTGVHNGNYTVELEEGERLFFEVDSFGSYFGDTFYLDLFVTYENGLSGNAYATANNVSSPITGGAFLSMLAGAFFMRKRKAKL